MTEKSQSALPSFSVVVLSHKRPHLLARVVWAISQLDYPNFEIVVVGDAPNIGAFGLPDFMAEQIKYVHYDEANICRSRNLALEISSGEVIAFIDDDAVPEPDWLRQLARAFAFPDVGGVGGLVRAADGLRIEWKGGTFDRTGAETPIVVRDDIRVFDADSQVYGGEFVGTLGANSAFRREAVLSVGGFDESFHYYLDETDMMLRLAEAGWDCALVLTAEVHHLREENSVRDGSRTPRNFFEIAASKAYFCRRHMRDGDVTACLDAFRDERIEELDPYIRSGLLRREDRKRLRQQVERGIAAGLARARTLPMTENFAENPFCRFCPPTDVPLSIAFATGWNPLQTREIRALARRLSARGMVVSYLSYMSGMHARRVSFADGVWMHSGGTWRTDHKVQNRTLIARKARARAEIERISARRKLDIVLSPMPVFGAGARKVRLPGTRWPLYADLTRREAMRLETSIQLIQDALQSPEVLSNSHRETPSLTEARPNAATDPSAITS